VQYQFILNIYNWQLQFKDIAIISKTMQAIIKNLKYNKSNDLKSNNK